MALSAREERKGSLWNRSEARLRAGWRVVLFVVASGVASIALAGAGRRVLRRLLPVVYANVIEVVVLVLLIGVFLWMAARWLDRRPIVDYGFHLSRAWWLDLGSDWRWACSSWPASTLWH